MIFYWCSRLHTAIGMISQKKEHYEVCETFITTICNTYPFKNKQKVHLLLHLVECMDEFGPTAVFSAERYIIYAILFSCTCVPFRCESFNSHIRSHNIFSNKQAPRRDIAHRYSVLEHIRFTCSSKRYVNHCCTCKFTPQFHV